MTLPDDVARCPGVGEPGAWREGCDDCLRRTSPSGPGTHWIEPPFIIVFECEYRLDETMMMISRIGRQA